MVYFMVLSVLQTIHRGIVELVNNELDRICQEGLMRAMKNVDQYN
jgi:hypothetical protein